MQKVLLGPPAWEVKFQVLQAEGDGAVFLPGRLVAYSWVQLELGSKVILETVRVQVVTAMEPQGLWPELELEEYVLLFGPISSFACQFLHLPA